MPYLRKQFGNHGGEFWRPFTCKVTKFEDKGKIIEGNESRITKNSYLCTPKAFNNSI